MVPFGFRFQPALPRFDGLWRAAVVSCGALITMASGSILVRAADDPFRNGLIQFNRPIRQAVQPYLMRDVTRHVGALPQERGYAAGRPALILPPRDFEPPRRIVLPQPARKPAPAAVSLPARSPWVSTKAHLARRSLATGGIAAATNYCVRLCDGFAFPLGQTGIGEHAQAAACRSACPGSETALYSLPPGARDLDQLRNGLARYTSLPNAFRYRTALTQACTCKPVGATLSSSAILGDLTLRPGDVVMTRIGMRHFDGSARFPYRASAFSDAVKKVPRREVAIVRAMEIASVRGILADSASGVVRARVIEGIRTESARVAGARIIDVRGAPAGFRDLQAREQRGPVVLPVVKRAPGLVALN